HRTRSLSLLLAGHAVPHYLHSFPTRRSSDLKEHLWLAREKALELLQKFGLQEFRDKYPGQLSGGMRRRVELAQAMINNPRLMIRSEEHTSELQSRGHLVCRLLLEKKKKQTAT